MACEEVDPSYHYVPQIPQPFVWTEDAHCLYLSSLEDAFVNDLYDRHYCSLDICGCSPPFTAHYPLSCTAAESPLSAAPPSPSLPQSSQPNAELKASWRRSCTGPKARCANRKGKRLSHEAGLGNQLVSESSIGPVENVPFLEQQPGSSSQPSENSEYVVPKTPRGRGMKRSRVKAVDTKPRSYGQRRGADQVVPLVSEAG